MLVLLPKDRPDLLRWFSLGASLVPFLLSLALWRGFDPGGEKFQFIEQAVWYPAINSAYQVGVDGIALTMVMLTTLLTPLCILASFSITEKIKAYMVLFLLLETGMLGVFMSLDLFLFFVFWEVGLVPMYFLINQWGGEQPKLCFFEVHPVHHGWFAGTAAGGPDDRRGGRNL